MEAAIPIACEEDLLRARLYAFLSELLMRPPDGERLAGLGKLTGDDTELGRGIAALARVAAGTSAEAVEREYHELFIGIGRGELVPYGSYYLTGFLNEKPLARLRQAMGELGIERVPSVKEPEDHIGALMEMMAGLITGTFARPLPVAEQREFFNAHVGSWAGYFFRDLEKARASVLYAPVGTIGRVFMDIEAAAFAMD